ncbi:MAG: Ig-like domain-containing protein, partial [Eubacteriales bacterium]|nr:Ig-like domain-containing protein [Eubacteriales bacterium]
MKKVALFLSVLFTLSSLIACVQKEPGESMLQSDLLVSEELSTDNSEISVAESDSSEDYVSKDDISIPDTSEDPSQAETSVETSKEDISKGDTSQKEESEVPKPSISLNSNSLEMRTGDTYKISPTVSGTGGATLTYKSSNSAVATVDTSGNVNAKSAGSAVITVS